jgi:hypothetical protein
MSSNSVVVTLPALSFVDLPHPSEVTDHRLEPNVINDSHFEIWNLIPIKLQAER